MNFIPNSRILNLLALFPLAIGLASATPVQSGGPCTTDTYADYISSLNGPGMGCTNPVDPNLEYYNFLFSTSSTGSNFDSPSNITVSPDGGFGFNFTGFQTVSTGDLTYFLGFNVDPAPVLTGDSISLDPPVGNVTLNLYICQQDTPFLTKGGEGGFFCSTQPNFADGSNSQIIFGETQPAATLINVNGKDQSTTASFAPTGQIGVLLQLTLNADDPASVGAIGSAPALILSTPEPASWILLASGLLLFLLKSRISALMRR